MTNQVLSIEQMQELKKLGINISKASCEWMHTQEYGWIFVQAGRGMYSDKEYIPTFTLQDILEMLPYNVEGAQLNVNLAICCISYENPRIKVCWYNNNILEAAFNMLKWCIKENYI